MEPPEMLPQDDRHVIVMLRDGRQLDELLIAYTDHYVCGGERFYAHEVDELTDDV